MNILIVSDAWHPQVNGVVRTLETTAQQLENMGHKVRVVGPDIARWNTFAAPGYRSIKLEFFARPRLRRVLNEFRPDFIHIATEGPLGWTARNLCLRQDRPFTTSYHTRFPEYIAARTPRFLASGVEALIYRILRRFHAPASAIMVAAPSIENELQKRGFKRLVRWSRGVDTALYKPYGKDFSVYASMPRPILLYVGRVAIEKNLRAFLDLKTPGTKVVVGDGPDLVHLHQCYPRTHFTGILTGEILARHYAGADLFVFPSLTDTFGLVLLEAASCGLRIASVIAPGPKDIFSNPDAALFSVLDDDLNRAVSKALQLPDDPDLPRRFAERFSWAACTRQFFDHLQAPTLPAVNRIRRLRTLLSRLGSML